MPPEWWGKGPSEPSYRNSTNLVVELNRCRWAIAQEYAQEEIDHRIDQLIEELMR
jgi:hypothetical protein